MVFGDPNKFAILIDYVPLWNIDSGFKNGLFHFIVEGEMFPSSASVATLGGDVGCLSDDNALITTPEDENLFKMNRLDAFSSMMRAMLPGLLDPNVDVPDDFETDYRYQASTYNLENDSCYVFSVGFMDEIRILAAKVSYLDGNDNDGYEWKNYDVFKVYDVILTKKEVHHIVSQVKEKYQII